ALELVIPLASGSVCMPVRVAGSALPPLAKIGLDRLSEHCRPPEPLHFRVSIQARQQLVINSNLYSSHVDRLSSLTRSGPAAPPAAASCPARSMRCQDSRI